MSDSARFMAKVSPEPNSGCWLWTAYCEPRYGYGRFQREIAHRVSYRLFVGAIPQGLLVCHRCDNPSCVNPDHLFLGTSSDNALDRNRKGRAASRAGEAHGRAKLTDSAVRTIRALRGVAQQRDVGEMFGVTQMTVSRIQRNDGWRHIS